MSDVMRDLFKVRSVAWAALVPAIDHAIALAREAEFVAHHSSTLAMCGIDPTYPPLVESLAAAASGVADLDGGEGRG